VFHPVRAYSVPRLFHELFHVFCERDDRLLLASSQACREKLRTLGAQKDGDELDRNVR
jgi:hypothetical protein